MSTRSKRANRLGMILVLAASVAARAQNATSAVASRPATQPAATQAALDPDIDRILTRLEERQVRDLRANVAWRQEYVTDNEEDWVTKRGEIWFQEADPVAKFFIHFTEKLAGNRRDKLDERHLFDGCWYVQADARTKTVERREVRRPNDPGNPYKVGEGVFPLPFGQKKADILREFDVQKVPAEDKDPPNADHLRLLPREGTRSGESYKQLDFWVDREGPTAGLPSKVRVAKIDGTGKVNSYITSTFSNVQLNTGFSGSVFELKTPPGYTETPPEYLNPIEPPKHER
jgi:hypothetical protein